MHQRHSFRFSLLGLTAAGLTLTPAALLAGGVPQTRDPERTASLVTRAHTVLATHCFKCHGGTAPLSKLDLTTSAAARRGGTHGPAVAPGRPQDSRLLRMVEGTLKPQMPPTGALSDADVAALREWIAAGAQWPAAAPQANGAADGRPGAGAPGSARPGSALTHWAFRPVARPTPPAVRDPWVRGPVDAFVLTRLRAAGLRPAPEADRSTLIRRVTFDLHGVPPTPEEVEQFVQDRSPHAYEKVVDRLLASPRYGERQARHWLDLARFAESEGFKADETRPNAWRYRDYVIESFNSDKPYNRFMMEQVAGDELYPDQPAALVATGFNRHWADESNARNIRLRRQEILNDITDTVGSVYLGLTVGCARCHDHKYDPIPQKDYYRLQAFFAASQPREDIPLVSRAELVRHRGAVAQWEARTRDTRVALEALEQPVREKLVRGKRMPFTPEVQDAIDTPPAKRTALQWQLFLKVSPQLEVKDEDIGKAMKGEEKARWERLRAEMAREAPKKPSDLPLALGITDVGRTAPPVHTLAVGVYDAPLEEVQPGFLSAATTEAPQIVPPREVESTGRRSALARWLGDARNPLTTRVIVNRIWQQHFGRGLVASASDFGRTGDPPTHPELLDWLAGTFTGRETLNWSVKGLHRLLVTTSAYRQSSRFEATAAAKDPQNLLLWRYRRWRLEGEAIRDAALLVSGRLSGKMGGPSIFPDLPRGVVTRGGWPVTADPQERDRRSVYIFVRRNMRYPLFEAFDFPDTHEPCARRNVTNTAPQALMLFNSELALGMAESMAGRIVQDAESPAGRVERAYRLAFGRAPESEEREQALQFLSRQSSLLRDRLGRGEKLAAPRGASGGDPAEGAALVDLCHALMNANEFLYVD